MAKEKVKLKVSTRTVAVFCALVAAVAVGVWGYVYYSANLAPVFSAEFEGIDVRFRADLREAQKVEVLPDEASLYAQIVKPPVLRENGQIIVRPTLRNVTIVFKSVDDSSRMGWYTVQAAEIIQKLTMLYKGKYGVEVAFSVREVQSYDGLSGTNTAPIIALVHPDIADGKYVSVDPVKDVITVSGGDGLRDFDRATTRLLALALGIKV